MDDVLKNLFDTRCSKLLINHNSEEFVQDRLRCLESYLQKLLSVPLLLNRILSCPKMVQWLTDFPKMNYSASDRPQIFQENEIIQSTSILPWGGPPAFIQDPGRNQRELGSSPTSSEWVCSSEAAAEVVPFCCFQESFAGRQSERKALFLDPSRWLTSPLPIDRAANSKWALHCGKIWQLRLDAIAVDAPEDYRARIRTVYWDVLEAAGRRRDMARSLALLDECQIGAVSVAPSGNLPSGALMLTAAPAYKSGYEFSAYASLHLCYRKVLEAAVDHGFRKVCRRARARSASQSSQRLKRRSVSANLAAAAAARRSRSTACTGRGAAFPEASQRTWHFRPCAPSSPVAAEIS